MIYRYLLIIIFALMTSTVQAEETGHPNLNLTAAPINRSDIESIKRGAKFFASSCMSCHTMVYLRYDKLANDAGVAYDKMPINVKTWPYGVTPPDLSLEANIRGINWIYTYLHSFYQDPSRPTGVNNLLVHNTAMPGIIVPFQGEQTLVKTNIPSGILFKDIQYYNVLQLQKQGMMDPDQFDSTMADLVNFLAYAAEPYSAEQRAIGPWVLGFLVIMFIMLWLLKREYWKDVKTYKKE